LVLGGFALACALGAVASTRRGTPAAQERKTIDSESHRPKVPVL
jgi:high-affinity iron transporter